MERAESYQEMNPEQRCVKSIEPYWGEALKESHVTINASLLECAYQSDVAEALALKIWENMTPEDYQTICEIDKSLKDGKEISAEDLRKIVCHISKKMGIDVNEHRAIHTSPLEALTLLLKHIIRIFNMEETDIDQIEELVPLSERIKEQTMRAEKLGLGTLEVSENMYVSERAKLAMLQTQLMGRLKLKSGTGTKMQNEWRKIKFKWRESCRKQEAKKRLKKVLEIRGQLRQSQASLECARSRLYKLNESQKIKEPIQKLQQKFEIVTSSTESYGSRGDSNCDECNVEPSKTEAIDTSSWVISPTHEYYFGSSPPVIPKTTVTHEVYPKPIECKILDCGKSGMDASEEVEGGGAVGPLNTSSIEFKHGVIEAEVAASTSRYLSTTSLVQNDVRETTNYEESQGDASTIYAWTEPEKSASFCLNTGDKLLEATGDDLMTEGNSDAAGDGCDLARTVEESNMEILPSDEQDELTEVPPPRPFSITDITLETDYTTSNESFGVHKKNMFSCNEWSFDQNLDFKQPEINNQSQISMAENFETERNSKCGNSMETLVVESEEPYAPKIENIKDEGQELIFTAPPAEPNGERQTTTFTKKLSMAHSEQQVNKSVIDELKGVFKRCSSTEDGEAVVTAYGSSTRTVEPEEPEKGKPLTPEIVVSCGDPSVKSQPDDSQTSSEYSPNVNIPTPPPMPPPLVLSEEFNSQHYGESPSRRSVDVFQSAHDFQGTQVLYIRPQRSPYKNKRTLQRSSVNTQENESEENQTTGPQSGRDASPWKRNDMLTLAVLAFTVGVGTLGYMAMAATGSANVFPEVLGVAGGRAVNVIEKALQVLKSLNNRL